MLVGKTFVGETLVAPSHPAMSQSRRTPEAIPWSPAVWLAILAAITLATFLIHGYHPLAEDGGLYVAGIEFKLDPTLFPHYTAFVTEHLHFSLFAPAIVAIIRLTHISLPWTLLLVDLFSIALTLYAARQILTHCTTSQPAQLAGICLLSAFWTLPIAGTSLMLMDPYVTARSLSTPLSLLAVAFALSPWPELLRSKETSHHLRRHQWRSITSCTLSLFAAAVFHPLMATYTIAFIIVLRLVGTRRSPILWTILLCATLVLAAAVNLLAPSESPAIIAAEHSRYYWFLSQWHWFELLGLAAPLAIFATLLHRLRNRTAVQDKTVASLCRACIITGLTSFLVALLFAHRNSSVHLVARLQPLRIFLLLYAVMALLLGATLTEQLLRVRQRSSNPFPRNALAALPILILLTLASTMFTVQRLTFHSSPHLELPWSQYTQNPWSQAFLWARDNTPRGALFALDADYIQQPMEDAQTFRATALRSALPDYSKDGGEAAITPSLASLWQPAAMAQTNLSYEPDTVREARIFSLGATWMVLHSTASTSHPCPYDNHTVKVCRL